MHARPAVIELHLERLRRHKTAGPPDQFVARRFLVLQMEVDLALDHVALALPTLCHVRRDGPGDHRAELRGVLRQTRLVPRYNATAVPASSKTAISAGICRPESPSITRGTEGSKSSRSSGESVANCQAGRPPRVVAP